MLFQEAAREVYLPRMRARDAALNLTCCLPPEAGRKA